MSKRESFLLWLFAGLLMWQAGLFTYGTVMCANVKAPQTVRTFALKLLITTTSLFRRPWARCWACWLVRQ